MERLKIVKAIEAEYWRRKKSERLSFEKLGKEIGVSKIVISDLVNYGIIRSDKTLAAFEAYLSK